MGEAAANAQSDTSIKLSSSTKVKFLAIPGVVAFVTPGVVHLLPTICQECYDNVNDNGDRTCLVIKPLGKPEFKLGKTITMNIGLASMSTSVGILIWQIAEASPNHPYAIVGIFVGCAAWFVLSIPPVIAGSV